MMKTFMMKTLIAEDLLGSILAFGPIPIQLQMRAEQLLKPFSGTQAIALKRAVLRFLPFAVSFGNRPRVKSTTMSFKLA
jgi:hypothetical protein